MTPFVNVWIFCQKPPLLPRFFGLDGVLYSMPVSDLLTFLFSAVLIVLTIRQLNEKANTTQKSKNKS